MNLFNRFKELSDEQQRYVKIGLAVLAAVIVVILFFGYNRTTFGNPEAPGSGEYGVPGATTSTIPGTIENDEPLSSGEYEGVPTVSTTTAPDLNNSEEDDVPEEGFANSVITAAQVEQVWPAAESGLSDSQRQRLNAEAALLVTATITGEGRDRFPSLFTDPNNKEGLYITNFKVQFATSMSSTFTQNGEPLYRTVVGWSGEDTGLIIRQARIANYFIEREGKLIPVPLGKLPVALQRSDGLLSGLTING